MSLLNTLSHLPGAGLAKGAIGGIDEGIGGFANGIGGLVGASGAGSGLITQGKNITNPAVNYQGKSNARPVGNDQNGSGTSTSDQTMSSGPVAGGGSSAPAYNSQDLAAYNMYTGQTQDALGKALDAFNAGQTNVNHSYDQQENELTSALNAAKGQYQTNVTGNQQSRLTNENAIHQQANAGYQSLLRVLGGMGAGGGSEAQYLVPEVVNQQASTQIGQAGQTYAKNAKSLDQNWGDYQNQEKNQQAQLDDWKSGQLATGAANYNSTKSNLLNILSGLQGKTAAPSDLGSALNNVVANIPNTIATNPTYTGSTPVYSAPTLDSYQAGGQPTAQTAQQSPGAGATTPYLTLLANDQKKQTIAA